MQVDWELSKTIPSVDGQGVRCACVIVAVAGQPSSSSSSDDEYRVILGTQGGSLLQVSLPSGDLTPIAYQHNHAVTALLSSKDSSFYVTACKDAAIRWFDATTHELLGTLEGHTKPVTSLSWCGEEYLLSGSWDGTSKVWDLKRKCVVATLPNHENSTCVVGLLAMNDNDATDSSSSSSSALLKIATGSAGNAQNNTIQGYTVRLWSVHTTTGQVQLLHQVANDHEGPIRGICLLNNDDNDIATCSNDGTVKLRSSETATCTGTLGFIAENPSHPPMLLSVASIPHDNVIVAGAEDGHVVFWQGTTSGEPQIVLHTDAVWNVLALPHGDCATCCDDGSLRIFTRATDRFAPAAERQAFAEVVAAARQKQQSGGPSPEEVAKLPNWETNLQTKGTSEGQVHLFQKDGVAIAAQWSMASQSWIEVGQVMGNTNQNAGQIDGVSYDHVLPIEVDQTGGGVARLQIGYNNGENTFSAAQRFIDAHMLPQHHLSEIANYIEQRVGSAAPTIGMGAPAAPVATTGTPIASYQHVPAKAYQSFELTSATVVDKIQTKLQETGQVTEAQWSLLNTLMKTLKATNRYHATKISAPELDVLADLLQTLPEPFPVLDLARMAVVHPDAAQHAHCWTKILSKALELCAQQQPQAVPIPLLTLRMAANAFRGGSLQAAGAHIPMMVEQAQRFATSKNKNIRLSVATVLYNVSKYIHNDNPHSYIPTLVPVFDTILQQSKLYDETGISRTLVALGTLLLAVPSVAKPAAQERFLASKVEPAASPFGPACKAAAKEVYALLQ